MSGKACKQDDHRVS